MEYTFNISAINAMGEGRKIKLNCKTDKAKPPSLAKPEVLSKEVNDGYIPIKLNEASERNGPIRFVLLSIY
jgi:hypothetical protein